MKQYLYALALTVGLFSCSTLGNLPGNTAVVTETEAAQGIREALDQGVGRGISLLNKENGFFNSQFYKILLPPDAQKIESTLRQLGMGSLVDRAILQVNRAAEDAVGYARPIFVDAIREMTITDAVAIIRGPRDAATQYFRNKTTEKLVAAFSPIIKSSLDRFSATKFYSDMVNTYNGFPTTLNKLNPDLPSFVVNRAVEALFDQVAQEEANIRTNAAARTTDLLKRVFGWAARTSGSQQAAN
ncbi:MAG TPA: DUF4197 domain-containing protein [Flavisolibacter sp.]|nr:DUF4197 domain-containing protein [Flavisolibacter sp.]